MIQSNRHIETPALNFYYLKKIILRFVLKDEWLYLSWVIVILLLVIIAILYVIKNITG